jgi:hypothetical protein
VRICAHPAASGIVNFDGTCHAAVMAPFVVHLPALPSVPRVWGVLS